MTNKVVSFQSAGGGLVKDSNAFTLADNEWSDVSNVRFRNRAVSKIAGEKTLLDVDNTPRHSVFLNGHSTGKFYYYIDSSGNTHRVNASGTESEVTKGISGTKSSLATGVTYQMSPVQGGYTLLVNDGDSTPQFITSVGTGNKTTELTDIPGWDYSDAFENVKAGVIRPFKYVLVAGNITQTDSSDNSIQRNAGTIRVSNQAAAGALPTWDTSLGSADTSDEFELSENGEIKEMVSLGDNLMIFTNDDIYGLTLTNSTTSPVRVSKQLSGRGILSTDCAVEFFGRLFVVGNEDIYIFQGGAATQSISDGRVREYFFNNLNSTHFDNTFTVHNERFDEIWVCFPDTDSSGACNKALIWNYVYNTWSERDLPNVFAGSQGPNIVSSAFDQSDFRPVLPSTSSLKLMDDGTTFSGTEFTAHVERKGMDLVAGTPGTSEWVDSIYFILTGEGTSTIKVRSTDTPGRPVDFSNDNDREIRTREFNIDGDASDLKIDPRRNGKFFNLRVEGSNDWNLHQYVCQFKTSDQRSK